MTRPHVLVTGATRGIGRAICEVLAPDHHLLVGGRDRAAVEAVCAALPSAEPFVAELTDAEAIEEAASGLTRLDAIVHNAAIAPRGRVDQVTRQQWREVFEVNVVAVADLTRLVLPLLREAGGQVVLINSGAGFFTPLEMAPYAASKHALRAFADGLREEERGRVRVSTVHPGPTDTQMQRSLNGDDGPRGLEPASVAAAVRTVLLASPEAMIETLSIRPVARA